MFRKLLNSLFLFNDPIAEKILDLEGDRIRHFIRHHEERYHYEDKPLYGKSIMEENEGLK